MKEDTMEEKRIKVDQLDMSILWKVYEEGGITPYMIAKEMEINKSPQFFQHRMDNLRELGWLVKGDGWKHQINEDTVRVDNDTEAMFLEDQRGKVWITAKPGSEMERDLPNILKSMKERAK